MRFFSPTKQDYATLLLIKVKERVFGKVSTDKNSRIYTQA